jgi:hypothetical protein
MKMNLPNWFPYCADESHNSGRNAVCARRVGKCAVRITLRRRGRKSSFAYLSESARAPRGCGAKK